MKVGKSTRLGKVLLGATRYAVEYPYQKQFRHVTVWTDTDFAGCSKTRKSTSAGIAKLGKHIIKSWTSSQSVIAQSSAEVE